MVRKLWQHLGEAAPWLAVTAVIGLVDYVTPPAYAFASIYFIPIFPAAWRSRAAGAIVAAASSAAWIFCDYVQRPVTDPGALAWNYGTRIIVFALAVLLASTLRTEQLKIIGLDKQRRSLLTLLEHEVPGPLRELATDLRALAGNITVADVERLSSRAEQLVFLSDDLASLGELEASGLRLQKRTTNVVEMVNELREHAPDRQHVLLTIPVGAVKVQADPDRLRQALDAMFREVSATSDTVSVDCRTERGSVAISIASATMTMPASPAAPIRSDDTAVGARTQLARLLLAAHGGQLFGARESMGRGQRLIARLPI